MSLSPAKFHIISEKSGETFPWFVVLLSMATINSNTSTSPAGSKVYPGNIPLRVRGTKGRRSDKRIVSTYLQFSVRNACEVFVQVWGYGRRWIIGGGGGSCGFRTCIISILAFMCYGRFFRNNKSVSKSSSVCDSKWCIFLFKNIKSGFF